jgi:hypothetical protein
MSEALHTLFATPAYAELVAQFRSSDPDKVDVVAPFLARVNAPSGPGTVRTSEVRAVLEASGGWGVITACADLTLAEPSGAAFEAKVLALTVISVLRDRTELDLWRPDFMAQYEAQIAALEHARWIGAPHAAALRTLPLGRGTDAQRLLGRAATEADVSAALFAPDGTRRF